MSNFLANTNTKEIHKLANQKPECRINEILPHHRRYLKYEFEVDNLIKNEGYNGCYWCYREKHTD